MAAIPNLHLDVSLTVLTHGPFEVHVLDFVWRQITEICTGLV